MTTALHQIDHREYPLGLRSKSDESLRYIMADARRAATVNPEGHKSGYYLDEVLYCAMELARREQ